ncbi:MAG TPA: hypothetical protein VFI17_01275 [Solirubrobacterales bacterium]|nr:hypothetical protein [Solirubrobacterales bacterium]
MGVPSTRSGVAAVLAALMLLLAAAYAEAASPGRPDLRFGDHGVVARDFGTERTVGRTLAAVDGPGGTTLVLQPGRAGVAVARYLPGGGLDPSFGDGGVALDPRTDADLDAEGTLAVGPGGEITASTSNAITRFTADGHLDRSYGDAGRVPRGNLPIGLATTVAEPDGSTIALSQYPFKPTSRPGIVAYRFGPNGTPDRDYGTDGRAFIPRPSQWDPVGAAMPQGDGLLIATPAVPPGSSERTVFLTRLDGDGQLDTSFGDGGSTWVVGPFGEPTGIVQQPGGAIVVATASNVFLRFTPDGRLDPTFGTGGVARGPVAKIRLNALAQTPDGALLAAGATQTRGEPDDFIAEKLTVDGAPDATFGAGKGFVTADPDPRLHHEARAVVAAGTGRVILAGEAVPPPGNVELEAFEASGAPAADFGDRGLVLTRTVAASADAATGLLVDRNGATAVAGIAFGRPAIARFSPRGRLLGSFGTGGTTLFPRVARGGEGEAGPSIAAGPDGSYLLGGGKGGPAGVLRVGHGGRIDRRFGNGGRAAADLRPALGIAVGPDGRIVAAGDALSSPLVRLRPDGALDRSLDRDGKIPAEAPIPSAPGDEAGYAAPVAVSPGGRIAALTDRWLPAELDRFGRPLAAVDARIRLAESRHRLPYRTVDLEFDGRKLLLLGVRGYGLAIARLLPNGRPDPDFGDGGLRVLRVGASLRPGRIAVEPDGKIVVDGVSFASRLGDPFEGKPGRAVVARFDPDGSLDRGFASGGVFRGRRPTVLRMSAIALGPGSVTAGGTSIAPESVDRKMFLLRLGR